MSPSRFSRGRRIVLLCEGDTEELAVKHFITRQWQQDGYQQIGLHPVNLNAKVQDAPIKARLFLDEPDVLGVFTLVDLYGMDRVVHAQNDPLDAKVARVRAWFSAKLVHARAGDFFPHVCVHETEAWLLAEGIALAKRLDDPGIKPDPQAELKNFQSPPQKRMNDLFVARKGDHYHKIRDGRPLLAAAQFQPVYGNCRFFRAFYDDLKQVGSR